MNLPKNAKVAFQGEPGAYSENAVYNFFGSTVQPIPCKQFSEVFRNVDTNRTDYGVVPIENSIEGSVNQVYDLFLLYDLKVNGELALKIDHCLIANPSTELDSIKIIYSHPQALAQCRTYLERFGSEFHSTYDTAGSVKMIREEGRMDAAAVASERAAEIYEMKILARDISNTPNNYTRFFLLSKTEVSPSGNDKTSIIFSTKHSPGSLYKALGELASRDINLTKLESRPTKQRPWEYNFYLDVEAHQHEKRCEDALEGLRANSVFVKVLGSYPKAPELSSPTNI